MLTPLERGVILVAVAMLSGGAVACGEPHEAVGEAPPALSPDGEHVAWAYQGRLNVSLVYDGHEVGFYNAILKDAPCRFVDQVTYQCLAFRVDDLLRVRVRPAP